MCKIRAPSEVSEKMNRFRFRLWTVFVTTLLLGCSPQANESRNGMFSIFKKKSSNEESSTVHAEVGAPLVRESVFPAEAGVPIEPVAASVSHYSVDGVPPNATLRPKSLEAGVSAAFVAAATDTRPALAFVNVSSAGRTELWELSSQNAFARQRIVQFAAAQGSWTNYFVHDIAMLPGELLLIGMRYREPRVKEALLLYDPSADTFQNLAPFATSGRFFSIARPTADSALVVYATNNTRLAAEQYYPAPTRAVLFSPRHPRGITVLELAPKDGSVDQWALIGGKLWIESMDNRQRTTAHKFVWSLDLTKLLP
jgi:hypothetical protein